MPHPNRIAPDGTFTTLPHRGAFMGNRGRLHDDTGAIRRPWASPAWITCTLRDKPGRPNPGVLPARGYTRLFFADEAVAMAAGHRPCAECRRAAYRVFRAAWGDAFGPPGPVRHLARDMDRVLHGARGLRPVTDIARLPDHAFILWQAIPHRIAGTHLIPFTHGAYGAAIPRPDAPAPLLTPAPLVAILAAGYRPAMSAADDRPNW